MDSRWIHPLEVLGRSSDMIGIWWHGTLRPFSRSQLQYLNLESTKTMNGLLCDEQIKHNFSNSITGSLWMVFKVDFEFVDLASIYKIIAPHYLNASPAKQWMRVPQNQSTWCELWRPSACSGMNGWDDDDDHIPSTCCRITSILRCHITANQNPAC